MTARYKNERPDIAIRFVSERNLGRCYNAYTYKITSLRRLSKEQILGLRELGFLGSGQEFSISSSCDGKEEPAGHDTVHCVEDDGTRAVNPYTGDLYKPNEEPFFVYRVTNRVDSGD